MKKILSSIVPSIVRLSKKKMSPALLALVIMITVPSVLIAITYPVILFTVDNQRGKYVEIETTKFIDEDSNYHFSVNFPEKSYRMVSLKFSGLSEVEHDFLVEVDKYQIKQFKINSHVSAYCEMKNNKFESKNNSLGRPIVKVDINNEFSVFSTTILQSEGRRNCTMEGYFDSENMNPEVFDKMSVTIDQVHTLYGHELKGYFIYEIILGIFYSIINSALLIFYLIAALGVL